METCADFKCKCGYEAHGKWGFGMNPIYREQNICLAPALCRDCRELVNINENGKTPKCPERNGSKVIPYSDPSLGQVRIKSAKRTKYSYRGPQSCNNSKKDDIDWLFFNDVGIEYYIEGVDAAVNLCPKCNRFTLEKTGGGLFD